MRILAHLPLCWFPCLSFSANHEVLCCSRNCGSPTCFCIITRSNGLKFSSSRLHQSVGSSLLALLLLRYLVVFLSDGQGALVRTRRCSIRRLFNTRFTVSSNGCLKACRSLSTPTNSALGPGQLRHVARFSGKPFFINLSTKRDCEGRTTRLTSKYMVERGYITSLKVAFVASGDQLHYRKFPEETFQLLYRSIPVAVAYAR
jgi:hypothetical protein